MTSRNIFNGAFFISLMAVGIYKFAVKQEPWAIGASQVIILWIILGFLYLAILNFDKVKRCLTEFFNEKDSPVNLAIFRIVFFAYLFFVTNSVEVLWYSQFPKELQHAPMGMGWLLPKLPIDLMTAGFILVLFKLSCLLAMFGWLTGFSTGLAAISGFYVLGIPQFYGSVSHYHHLFWFLVIFAVSRCGDALSLDAVIRNLRKGERNESTDIPGASRAYALPLRFIWILLGIAYFFPGFWKLWNSGTAWITGDNLKNHMYVVWTSFDYWLPSVRIDQWPWLCRLSAVVVIFFEMNFIFLIFVKGLRYFAAFQGLVFHNLTNLIMKIDFYELQMCYVSFFNWKKIFEKLGVKLFRQEMIVLYDGSCSFCRQAIGFLQVFDVMGRIQYLDLHGIISQDVRDRFKISDSDLMKDMHAVIGDQIIKGFESYRKIAARIPLLWIIYPFLFFGLVKSVGNSIYRKVADSRSCRIFPKRIQEVKTTQSNAVLVCVASVLIVGNITMGLLKVGSGWPFACYPTFSEIAWDKLRTINFEIVQHDGTVKTVNFQSLRKYTGLYKIDGMVGKIFSLKDEELKRKRLRALCLVLLRSTPGIRDVKSMRLYFQENYTDPAKWGLEPVNKILAFEFHPQDNS